jgi:septum formation protein
MHIVLASSSERRVELLGKIIKKFAVIPPGFDESGVNIRDPVRRAILSATGKALSVAKNVKDSLVIGGDTVVSLGEELFGKPRDEKDAYRILSRLSGTEHTVVSAVAVVNTTTDKVLSDYDSTRVKLKKISDDEILAYISTGEGMDKAGAYAIQEEGDKFIEYIQGDYQTVVGLPLKKLKRILKKMTCK